MKSFIRWSAIVAVVVAGAAGADGAKFKNVDELLRHADKCHNDPASCRKDLRLEEMGITVGVSPDEPWEVAFEEENGTRHDVLRLLPPGRASHTLIWQLGEGSRCGEVMPKMASQESVKIIDDPGLLSPSWFPQVQVQPMKYGHSQKVVCMDVPEGALFFAISGSPKLASEDVSAIHELLELVAAQRSRVLHHDNASDAPSTPQPERTSADGKYSELLQTLPCPADKKSYGDFKDWGHWNGGAWCGQNGVAGYWVYAYPNWYVWKTKR